MRVGDSVRLSIDDANCGEWEAAMLHACNAVDGTAAKASTGSTGVGKRFMGLLRDNADILGRMGLPGVDPVRTEFPVRVDGAYHATLPGSSTASQMHPRTRGRTHRWIRLDPRGDPSAAWHK